jgi:hypothetical protein
MCQLAHGVGSPLCGSPRVHPMGCANLGIDYRLQGRENSLAAFRIELSLYTNHSCGRRTNVQVPAATENLGTIGMLFVYGLGPIADHST